MFEPMFASEVKEIQLLVKHMAGRHNQQSHGNRWRVSDTGGHRELIHRGGGKPGHNVTPGIRVPILGKPHGKKPVGAGGTTQPDPHSTAPANKPTHEAQAKIDAALKEAIAHPLKTGDQLPGALMEQGTLNKFGESWNKTFTLEYGGKKFFVKGPGELEYGGFTDEEVTANEQLGPAIAEAMGVGDKVIPTGTIEHGGTTYVVQPWLEGSQQSWSGQAEIALSKGIGTKNATELLAIELMMGSSDRHGGNLIYHNGGWKEIDFGFSSMQNSMHLGVSESHLWTHLSSKDQVINVPALSAMLAKESTSAVLNATQKYRPDCGMVMAKRLNKLHDILRYAKEHPGANWYDAPHIA